MLALLFTLFIELYWRCWYISSDDVGTSADESYGDL